MLSNENYIEWKNTLECMDLNLAFHENKPLIFLYYNLSNEKAAYERCEQFNRLTLILIKAHISKALGF